MCPLPTLQNLAKMFAHVKTTDQKFKSSPLQFPKAGYAITAASGAPPFNIDVANAIRASHAIGQRSIWAESTPGSIFLMPVGQTTGAAADLVDVTYDNKVSDAEWGARWRGGSTPGSKTFRRLWVRLLVLLQIWLTWRTTTLSECTHCVAKEGVLSQQFRQHISDACGPNNSTGTCGRSGGHGVRQQSECTHLDEE
jgi:hypothetical protein